jgi:hypothetical protein
MDDSRSQIKERIARLPDAPGVYRSTTKKKSFTLARQKT